MVLLALPSNLAVEESSNLPALICGQEVGLLMVIAAEIIRQLLLQCLETCELARGRGSTSRAELDPLHITAYTPIWVQLNTAMQNAFCVAELV